MFDQVITVTRDTNLTQERQKLSPTTRLLVIVKGGDGTLNQAFNCFYPYCQTAFALWPTGTGNDFARAFYLTENIAGIKLMYERELLDLVLSQSPPGRERQVDIIKCRKVSSPVTKYALNSVSFGATAQVCARKEMSKTNKSYFSNGLKMLTKLPNLKIKLKIFWATEIIEIETSQCCDFSVANSGWRGGGFLFDRQADIASGWLNWLLLAKVNPVSALKIIWQAKRNQPLTGTRSTIVQKGQVMFLTLTNLDKNIITWQYDGEVDFLEPGDTVEMSVLPAAATFWLPF
jgi:diacylglycerol kinase family enzyme